MAIFAKVLATLKRTFGTGSDANEITVGIINLVVMSVPHGSARTYIYRDSQTSNKGKNNTETNKLLNLS